ncbi:hypothetical protein Bbelb_174930 [Branchiostoma belcheri]|nr:hypothetical protein Bbelb_174930 [Branchiostoma belcheri]
MGDAKSGSHPKLVTKCESLPGKFVRRRPDFGSSGRHNRYRTARQSLSCQHPSLVPSLIVVGTVFFGAAGSLPRPTQLPTQLGFPVATIRLDIPGCQHPCVCTSTLRSLGVKITRPEDCDVGDSLYQHV